MSTDPETRNQDANRRLESAIRIGVVAEADYATSRVRVQSGGLLTGWLPWLERRMGDTVDWDPPHPGEQVVILSPSGEVASGIVLTGIPSDSCPHPIHDKNKCHRRYTDGATFEYDHKGHHYTVTVPNGGSIVFTIGATTLTLTGSDTTLVTPNLLVDSPASTFTGTVLIQKLLTWLAGMIGRSGSDGGAGAAIEGNVQVEGNISATGSIMDGGGNSNHHSH